MPQSFDNAAIAEAERHWDRGNLREALTGYLGVLQNRLNRTSVSDALNISWSDVVVISRVAELASHFRHGDAADLAYKTVIDAFERAGNDSMVFHAKLQRASLHLESGHLHKARDILNSLEKFIGDVEHTDLTEDELRAWEQRCRWPTNKSEDQHILLVRLYWLLGRVAAANGRYAGAKICFERGLALCLEIVSNVVF